jgi:hypothetical protein
MKVERATALEKGLASCRQAGCYWSTIGGFLLADENSIGGTTTSKLIISHAKIYMFIINKIQFDHS